ncbi:MAG: hypothetical protein JWQ61_2929 [Collimonas fungivorans]|uniref:transmembrane-type terpene cyclase n=1 Tax=Collimonas fungivorans TaxID=158899 RepID=UPI0026EF90C7|nr:hypothetical protein [Collimonas fungivorans]MDB5768115.1 hypothetical protein [Collimonas fungivorans]
MDLFLTLLSGLCWIVVYVECARIGFKYKTYAMPAFALSLNIGWEALYSYIDVTEGAGNKVMLSFSVSWLLLDIVIAYTYFRYGKKYWPEKFSRGGFIAWSILMFIMSFSVQLLFLREFGAHAGKGYSAFFLNLLMSVLFIDMFIKRKGGDGQSLVIAVNKWIGSLAPTVLYGLIEYNFFILVIGGFCAAYDLIYIALLVKTRSGRA